MVTIGKLSKNFSKILIVTLLISMIICFMGTAKATIIFHDSFASGNANAWTGTHTQYNGVLDFTNYGDYDDDGYSLRCSTPTYSNNGAQAYAYQYLGNTYNQLGMSAIFTWAAGYPASGNVEGFKIMGFGNSYLGAAITVMVYNTGSAYDLGVRVYTSGAWVNYISSTSINQFQGYAIEFVATTSSFTLYLNQVNILSETGLTITSYSYAYVGNTYNGGNGILFSIDDVTIGTTYVGIPPSTNVYYSSYQETILTTSNLLSYPSVFDGYLWVVASHGTPVIQKFTLSGTPITQANLNNSLDECFAPFVMDGLIYIPASSVGYTKGCITVLNETTLQTVAFYQTSTICNYIVNTAFDNVNRRLLFGCDMLNGSFCILYVPIDESTNTADYNFISIASNPDTAMSLGDESIVCTFQNQVFVSCGSGHLDGTTGQVRSRLYNSSSYTTWTLADEQLGTNTAPNAYFSHVSATSNYICFSYVSYATTGVTTYRIGYSSDGVTFNELDTGIMENSGEDHPNINAIGANNYFIFEASDRDNVVAHNLYLFFAPTGTLSYLFTVYDSTGYNDRWVGIDAANNVIYVADCYATASTSQIIKINWIYPFVGLALPIYETDTFTYPPTPTPTPISSPTPTTWQIIPPVNWNQIEAILTIVAIFALIFVCGGLGWWCMKSAFGGLVGINIGVILGYAIPLEFGYTFIPLWAVIVIIVIDAIYATKGYF
jgi:hypothetical protein